LTGTFEFSLRFFFFFNVCRRRIMPCRRDAIIIKNIFFIIILLYLYKYNIVFQTTLIGRSSLRARKKTDDRPVTAVRLAEAYTARVIIDVSIYFCLINILITSRLMYFKKLQRVIHLRYTRRVRVRQLLNIY